MQASHLMCELMGNNLGDTQFVWSWGLVGVKKEACLSVGGQSPVLHRTWLEVRDSSQICRDQHREHHLLVPSIVFVFNSPLKHIIIQNASNCANYILYLLFRWLQKTLQVFSEYFFKISLLFYSSSGHSKMEKCLTSPNTEHLCS